MAEDLVGEEDFLCLGHVFGDVGRLVPDPVAQRLLHLIEMCAQVVDPEGPREIGLIPSREQLCHVSEVAQPVIDRRGREHEEGFRPLRVVEQVVEPVVPGGLDAVVLSTAPSWIAEVVCFVDDHYVSQLRDAAEALRKVALATQVRVAENGKITEVGAAADTSDMRKPLAQVRLPDTFLRCLGRKEHDALSLVQDEALDQHQAHEGLAETDTVAEERAAVLACDLHERPIGFLLITVDTGEHLRAGLVPLAGC